MADENKKQNYFDFWKNHLGREAIIVDNNGKEFPGTIRAILTDYLNVILDTSTDHLIFRGQTIHHIIIPRGKKNEK